MSKNKLDKDEEERKETMRKRRQSQATSPSPPRAPQKQSLSPDVSKDYKISAERRDNLKAFRKFKAKVRNAEKITPKKDYTKMSDTEPMDPSSSFSKEKRGNSNKNIERYLGRKSIPIDSQSKQSKTFLDTFVNLKPNLAVLFKDESMKKRLSNGSDD